MEMTPEKTKKDLESINTSLQSFEERKAELKSLADSCKDLSIENQDDKKGFEEVTIARKKLKEVRVAIAKEGKQMRDLITPITKMISEKEKELIAIIEPVEDSLESKEKEYLAEKQRIKDDIERKERERVQNRVDQLLKYGCVMDYIIVAGMEDDEFNSVLEKHKSEFEAEQERIAKEKADEEKRKREEAEQIERDKKALALEREKMERERAELDRIKRESEEREAAFKKQKNDLRCSQLVAIGMLSDGSKYIKHGFHVSLFEIELLNDDEWIKKLDTLKSAIEKRNTEIIQEEVEAEKKRVRDAEEKAKQELADHKKREAEELAKQKELMPDKEKLFLVPGMVENFQKEISSLAVKTSKGKQVKQQIIDGIDRLLVTVNSSINQLK